MLQFHLVFYDCEFLKVFCLCAVFTVLIKKHTENLNFQGKINGILLFLFVCMISAW